MRSGRRGRRFKSCHPDFLEVEITTRLASRPHQGPSSLMDFGDTFRDTFWSTKGTKTARELPETDTLFCVVATPRSSGVATGPADAARRSRDAFPRRGLHCFVIVHGSSPAIFSASQSRQIDPFLLPALDYRRVWRPDVLHRVRIELQDGDAKCLETSGLICAQRFGKPS